MANTRNPDLIKGRVEKRYKTSWTIIIEKGYDKATKKRDKIVKSVKVETEDEATAIMNEMIVDIRRKQFVRPGTMTFGQYLDKWLAFRKSKLAPKTYHSYYCEIERHIKPNIGNILLQELEAIDLQEYYYKMETEGRIKPENIKGRKKEEDSKKKNPRKEVSPGLSQRTIYYHHRIISTALKQAAKWKMIPQNPALLVDAPSYKKKEMSFLKKSELEQFFKEVKEEMDYPVIYAGVMTGMRQGELLGLRWRDVDFDTGMINIRQQLQYMPGEGVFFKTPKSIKSIRSIPMQLPLSKMFRNIKRAQESYQIEEFKKLKREEVGELTESDLKKVYDDHDLVLCRNNGKPLDASKLTNRFKELVIKFGRPDIRFHDLRHTFAALAIAAGITMDKLQRIMGHESITTTIDMYGHIPEDALSEEMKKLSEYLGFETLAE
jgi:integrase